MGITNSNLTRKITVLERKMATLENENNNLRDNFSSSLKSVESLAKNTEKTVDCVDKLQEATKSNWIQIELLKTTVKTLDARHELLFDEYIRMKKNTDNNIEQVKHLIDTLDLLVSTIKLNAKKSTDDGFKEVINELQQKLTFYRLSNMAPEPAPEALG